MKNIFLFVLLSSTSSMVFGQQTDQQRNNLKKNNVAVYTGSVITLKNGQLRTDECSNERTLLDDEGRATKQIITNVNDKWGTLFEYHYNKCNKIDSINEFQIIQGKRLVKQHNISVFDDSCRLIKTFSTDSSNKAVWAQTAIEYDETGKRIKETQSEGDKIKIIVKFTYADSCVERNASFANGDFLYHKKEFFDDKGNITKLVTFDANGKASEEVIRYDYDNDNIISERHYDNDGKLVYSITNEYDRDNLLRQSITTRVDNPEPYETILTRSYRKAE